MLRTFAFTLIISFCFGIAASAQLSLKPTIGLESLPLNEDSVCEIPLRTGGGFDTLGLNVSDTVPDFNFFDRNDNAYHLQSILEEGKPALLVTGSYTCPVFRNRLPELNQLQSEFGNEITIIIIYTLEAHPDSSISPYYGYVSVSVQNTMEGILFDQPPTYGERKALVDTLLSNIQVDVPVLIDGPCNNFWMAFGCGPNTAYLIRTDGIIFSKHGWFNLEPQNMANDINTLLGNEVEIDSATYDGHFEFTLEDEPYATLMPGETAYLSATLTNTDSSRGVLVEIVRRSTEIPETWKTSLCTDVCYSPVVDSATLYLEPLTKKVFTLDVYTSATEDSGSVTISFRNHFYADEDYQQEYRVSTMVIDSSDALKVYPNPTSGLISVTAGSTMTPDSRLELYNLSGELLLNFSGISGDFELDLTLLPAGMYFLRLGDEVLKVLKY